MLRNVLLLITGTKRKSKTKTFLVYDENREENASFDVRDLTTRHKHFSKGKKTLPVFDPERDVNDLKFQLLNKC